MKVFSTKKAKDGTFNNIHSVDCLKKKLDVDVNVGRTSVSIFIFMLAAPFLFIDIYMLDWGGYILVAVMSAICMYGLYTGLSLLHDISAIYVSAVTDSAAPDDKSRFRAADIKKAHNRMRLTSFLLVGAVVIVVLSIILAEAKVPYIRVPTEG